jgi:hypothetical protein
MLQRIVWKWIERFKNGRTSVKHGEGTGRQSTSITDADMEQVYGMILQNRRVTVDEVAHQLKIIRSSAYEIIHKFLYIMRGFKTSGDAFRLPYSIAFDYGF